MPQPPQRKQSSTSTRIVWRAFVEVENEDGTTTRQGVVAQHTVIGRSPTLPISFDHDTVSRRHAELFSDPFGRWWIRDLGSTNGTTVNGERVAERVLQPGDRLGIGDMRMRFRLGIDSDVNQPPSPSPRVAESTQLSISRHPSWVKSLSEVATPQISASHLSRVMELSRKLLNQEDLNLRRAALCELMISESFHGASAMVLSLRGDEPVAILSGPHTPSNVTQSPNLPHIRRDVLSQVAGTSEAAVGSERTSGSQPPPAQSWQRPASIAPPQNDGSPALSAVASPLGLDGDLLTVLYVNLPPRYGNPEWLALIALAGEVFQQAETAWTARRHAQEHAAIERELETARQIQQALVPTNLSYEGLELAVGFAPCKWVGGDYVGAVPATDGRVIMAVADVCGKGLQPALITFSVHTMLSALADSGRSIADVMDRLNQHLLEYMPDDSFVTMICIAVDPRTGSLEVVNAGHPPPLVFPADGPPRFLQSAMNPALGVGRFEMKAQKTMIRDGELLFLYTDGLTELRDPSRVMLGEANLATNVGGIYRELSGGSLRDVGAEVSAMLDTYRGGELPEDDRAFLLARRLGR